jgi:hypothetical protein
VPGLRWAARCSAGAVMAVLYGAAVLFGAFAIMSIIATGPGR